MNSDIHFRQITHKYIDQILSLFQEVFYYVPDEDRWDGEDLEALIELFSEGTILAIDSRIDKLVGIGTGIYIDFDFDKLPEKEEDLIFIDRIMHNPLGDYYYGIDLAVSPLYRRQRIARTIYDHRKKLIIKDNKQGFVASAAIPGYENEKSRMTHDTYIKKVVNKEIFDPTLSVQLRNGFKVMRPLQNFFAHEETDHCGALIFWDNENYEA